MRILYVIDAYAAETYMELTMTRLQTVVELPEFQRRAKAIMSDQEREAAISFIAGNPEAGISLGGGLCKIRILRGGERQEWWLQDGVCLWRAPYADLSDHGLRQ